MSEKEDRESDQPSPPARNQAIRAAKFDLGKSPQSSARTPEIRAAADPGKKSSGSTRIRAAASAPGEDLTESVTENVDARAATSSATPDETEEVLVILPEDDNSQLPVVETVVVEDQAWDSGPTTTEVLKDVPADLQGGTPASLEDVPLMKVNPLVAASSETETVSPDEADSFSPGGGGGSSRRDEEEIKVIDEIADIAGDLDREESLDEEGRKPSRVSVPRATEAMVLHHTGGSRKVRILTMLSSVAALVLIGVFFYSDLIALYHKVTGTEPPAGGNGQVVAIGPQGSGPGGGDPHGQPGGMKGREELRSKVLLSMQIGLRADGGKE